MLSCRISASLRWAHLLICRTQWCRACLCRSIDCFLCVQTTVDSWEGTGTGFSGKISHHGRGKPFKDGFVNKKAVSAAAEQAKSEEEQEQEGNDVGAPDRCLSRLSEVACRLSGAFGMHALA